MKIKRELLRAVFDIAVGSMDFGSGFLDDDEVTALRSVAERLGVNPMEGTPENYRKRIVHEFEQYVPPAAVLEQRVAMGLGDVPYPEGCRWCSHRRAAELHGDPATFEAPPLGPAYRCDVGDEISWAHALEGKDS